MKRGRTYRRGRPRRPFIPEPASPHHRLVDAGLWALSWVLLVLGIYYSLGPRPPGAGAFPNADKVGHGLLYAATVSGFLLAACWRPGRGSGRFPRGAGVIVAVAIGIGLVVEVIQGAFFGRNPSWLDAVADAVGSTIAYVIWKSRKHEAPGRGSLSEDPAEHE